jgi:EAL domain-containing protein (putative c-di-GMP-specific phosphodiesterase class I)
MRIHIAAALVLSAGISGLAWYYSGRPPILAMAFTGAEIVLLGLATFGFLLAIFATLKARQISQSLAGTIAGFEEFEAELARRLAAIDNKDPVGAAAWETAGQNLKNGLSQAEHSEIPVARHDLPADARSQTVMKDPNAGQDSECASEDGMKAYIAEAIRNGEVTSWYEPVVMLPERTTRYLEAKPYLPGPSGGMLAPDQWLDQLKPKTLRANVDLQMLDQAIRLARELERGNRNCGVIIRLNWRQSGLPDNAEKLVRVATANSGLCDRLLFDVPLPDFSRFDAKSNKLIATLRDLGYQLALSQCSDTGTVERALLTGQFRFVMPDSNLLMSPDRIAMFRLIKIEGPDGRNVPIEIIAKGIENEEAAIEMIDQNILLAQGPLFSPARPLKPITSDHREIVTPARLSALR